MRRSALLVLPWLIVGATVAVTGSAQAYTPSVKPTARTIAAGDLHSVFIAADKLSYGTGAGTIGQITGSASQSTATAFHGVTQVPAQAVSAAGASTLVLGTDGKVDGTGDNSSGQLTGNADHYLLLTVLAGLPGIAAKAVASGPNFSLVLGSDGKVYGTGDNSFGQLTGPPVLDGIRTLTPLTGLPNGVMATAISAGTSFSVVLGSDHRAYGTGLNDVGQISGSDSPTTLRPFADMPVGVRVTAIDAGSADTVFLGSDQHAYALGSNLSGQFGRSPDANPHPSAVRLPIEQVVAVSAGNQAIGLVDSFGVPSVAGDNSSGTLASPDSVVSTFQPMHMKTGTPSTAKIVEIDLGANHSLLRDADGVVIGAGDNEFGELTGATQPVRSVALLTGQKVINYVRPTVTGTRQVGHTLTGHVGSWSVKPTHYTYKWLRNGSTITGATGATYNLISTDKGKHLSVQVAGTRSGGFASGVATSTATVAIAP